MIEFLGIKRERGMLKSAEALQSVFLVASPFDVFLRFKVKCTMLLEMLTHKIRSQLTTPVFIPSLMINMLSWRNLQPMQS